MQCLQNGLVKEDDIGTVIHFDPKTIHSPNMTKHEVKDMDAFKVSLKSIYKRYIDQYGEYSVNIASSTRCNWRECVQEMDGNDDSEHSKPSIFSVIGRLGTNRSRKDSVSPKIKPKTEEINTPLSAFKANHGHIGICDDDQSGHSQFKFNVFMEDGFPEIGTESEHGALEM